MADRKSDPGPSPPEPVDVAAPSEPEHPPAESPFPRPVLDEVVANDIPFARPDLTEGYPLEKRERASLRDAIRGLERDPPSPAASDGSESLGDDE